MATRKLKLTEVPVIVFEHLSEAQKRALVIADNQLALDSGWDQEMLRVELAILQKGDYNLALLGLEDEQLARLLASQDMTEGLTDEDEIPTPPATPLTKLGDLWFLGQHRLISGDSTVSGIVNNSDRTGKVSNNDRSDWREAWALVTSRMHSTVRYTPAL